MRTQGLQGLLLGICVCTDCYKACARKDCRKAYVPAGTAARDVQTQELQGLLQGICVCRDCCKAYASAGTAANPRPAGTAARHMRLQGLLQGMCQDATEDEIAMVQPTPLILVY
eukprot:1160499-Pelagomonas_calceolata.AAC.9